MGRRVLEDKRICVNCGTDKTYFYIGKKRRFVQWRNHNGKWYCKKCHSKLWDNPKFHPILNPRKIKFKDRFVSLKYNPRKGICSWCSKTGLTHIHHIAYHADNVLKDTIELCVSCHVKETWRLRKIRNV